jgi:hypothetical protein
MQYNLRLVQLFLNLHYAVCLLRILVFHDIFFELREIEGGVAVCKGGARIAREEFIDYFREQLMRDEGWVIGIADYYAGDAFGAAVGMKGIGWKERAFSGGAIEGESGFE